MKLPVFKAIGATFAYFTGAFGTVLRIMWLPLLLMGTGLAFVMPGYFEASIAVMALGPQPDPQTVLPLFAPLMKWMGLMMLVLAIGYPMLFAGVMRHVIRGEAPRAPFYLSYGADEIRVLITFVLTMILLGVVYVIGVIAIAIFLGIIGVAAAAGGGIIAAVLAPVAIVAFIGVTVWFALRLSLALPAAVGERGIGVSKSWSFARGNVWRLFLYWLFWCVVFFALQVVMMLVIYPDYLSDMAQTMSLAMDEEAMHAAQLEMMRKNAALFSLSSPKFPLIAAAGFVYGFLMIGLWAASSAVAYRYVADEQN